MHSTKKKPVIGVIGGAGPDAAIDFQAQLYKEMKKQLIAVSDQDHYRVIVDNYTSMPDRSLALLKQGPSPLPDMIKSATGLEKLGCNFITYPCNTAHAYLPQIANAIKIPITVTVLVLGPDGHIASLFPGESRNWLGQSNCQIASSNNHEYTRITLTPNYICNSRLILLLVSDVERVNLCEVLLDGGDEDEYPARILFNQNKTPVEIFSV